MDVIQTNKDRYRILCTEMKNIPLFMQAWWMDAVCYNKKWDVLIFEKKNKIVGVLVYHFIKKLGFKIIVQPLFTQYNGIWIDYPEQLSKNETLGFEKEIMTNLIEQLESLKFSYYAQNFGPSVTNWLPYYWKGFEQTTRYTYQITDLSDTEKCFQQFSHAKKKQINKAGKTLLIDQQLSGVEFYNHVKKNLNTIGKKLSYTEDLFFRLFEACKSRNQGCIISARNEQKQLHAALFIIWDENCAYNLISTIAPEFRSSGASSLVVWEAIKQMSNRTKVFDFEGSMEESIENSFRQFGTKQVPYLRIIMHNSLSVRILYFLKKWL